ncbi:MAG: hypothetical protein H3Z51_13940 [archaeon]|nr:hypothetical protein [archaeon]
MDSAFLGRKRQRALFTIAIYQLQTAEATSSSWGPGNLRAYERVQGSIGGMNFKVAGGYHSHPEDDPELSEDDGDVEYAVDAIKDLQRKGIRTAKESRWLEIVVSVKKKLYQQTYERDFRLTNLKRKIRCTLRMGSNIGYDLTLGAYWIDDEGNYDEAEIYVR